MGKTTKKVPIISQRDFDRMVEIYREGRHITQPDAGPCLSEEALLAEAIAKAPNQDVREHILRCGPCFERYMDARCGHIHTSS